jgi:hypothetical protein
VDGVALDGGKEILLDEWTIFPNHREIVLDMAVDGSAATVSYGNGVVVVALPVAAGPRPARAHPRSDRPQSGASEPATPHHPAPTRGGLSVVARSQTPVSRAAA